MYINIDLKKKSRCIFTLLRKAGDNSKIISTFCEVYKKFSLRSGRIILILPVKFVNYYIFHDNMMLPFINQCHIV